MAYMCQTKKRAIAPQIKAVLAKYGMKGTIAVRDRMALVVNIKSGALDLIGQANRDNKALAERRGDRFYEVDGHYQANPYYASEGGDEKINSFFKELIQAMNGKGSGFGNHDNSDAMTDYFDVGWYLSINVGDYGKPYQLTK